MEQPETSILDLAPSVVTRILATFAEEPVSILNFGLACKAALAVAGDEGLWRGFCGGVPEFAGATDPAAWGVASHRQLWGGCMLPFRRLLGRMWQSCTWASGQLVWVDVEPPRLVGRSLHFRSLNASPLAHDIFVVQFDGSKGGKTCVTCWRDKHSDEAFEAPAEIAWLACGGAFALRCSGRCDSAATEVANRHRGRPYNDIRQRYITQQQQQGQATGGATASGRGTASGVPGVLPLPDVAPVPNFDFVHFISMSDMQYNFKTPLFRPLATDSPWLGPPPADIGNSSSAAAAAASLAGLTGLWRGAYGSHGVEVVQLQLLQAPPGLRLYEPGPQQAGVAAAEAFLEAEGAAGVLLHGLAGLPHEADPGISNMASAAAATTAHAPPQQAGAGAAAGPATSPQAGSTTSDQHQQQQQASSVLLVATKLTGDTNVPAGRVTFAVDAGSWSSEGAGSPMVRLLPPNFTSDTHMTSKTRPLIVKARVKGRAQIAYPKFQSPNVIPAVMVLFEGVDDAVGLLWGRPVHSFSLFSRASQLPGVQ